MLNIKITEAQRENLVQFLLRTELKGREAYALIELFSIIQSAKEDEIE